MSSIIQNDKIVYNHLIYCAMNIKRSLSVETIMSDSNTVKRLKLLLHNINVWKTMLAHADFAVRYVKVGVEGAHYLT